MMKQPIIKLCGFAVALLLLASCKHEVPQPIDEGGLVGNGGGGTEWPCDPDSVYFQQDIMPLIISRCGVPECHDSYSGEPEFPLLTYQDLLNNLEEDDLVIPGNAGESEIIDVILNGEMPPVGYANLSPDQITLLQTWINQGAQNNSCEDLYCDTLNVTFSGTIQPLIQNKCYGCHHGSSPQGDVSLTSYDEIELYATSGVLEGVVNAEPGYEPMPLNANSLPQCNLDQIRIWIEAGAPNN